MAKVSILIATANPHKAGEIAALLPQTGAEYKSLADFPALRMPEETGATLEENAALKAVFAAKAAGLWALADDTGLEVDALGGAPGVYSARYSGKERDYPANNAKLLRELAGVPAVKRTARFRTVAALASPSGKILSEEGRLEGKIGFEPRGGNGFGYDPLFIVPSLGKTLAELSFAEKNRLSHRRAALAAMIRHIKAILRAGR
ncbi:MAG: RdgB/HAM1 family non-canonical purine NTP pyrophosphatase [Elusimicrobiales bacterium]|nr:RdgB/HAM1 family non-canonical purine NTP pyrophosphatase [Elusimicrobiales bacterium]